MKLFNTISLVSSFVAAESKKVPPRTPVQRLITLRDIYVSYVDNKIHSFRRDRYKNQAYRIRQMSAFMESSYLNCPRPDNSANAERKRRDVDAEDPFDVYEQKYQDGDDSTSVQLYQDSALALRQVFIDEITKLWESSKEPCP